MGAAAGPFPATATLVGGATKVFTYTFSAANVTYNATVTFTGSALGQDANTGASVSALAPTSNGVNIFPRANLSVESFVFSSAFPVSVGHRF